MAKRRIVKAQRRLTKTGKRRTRRATKSKSKTKSITKTELKKIANAAAIKAVRGCGFTVAHRKRRTTRRRKTSGKRKRSRTSSKL